MRHLLAEAIALEKGLKVCGAHPEQVWYDESECPACSLMRELSRTQKAALPGKKGL